MRQFIYQFKNGLSNDVEDDPSRTREIPSIGDHITRNGKDWKVVHVVAPPSASGATPVVRVFLADVGKWRTPVPRPGG